MANLLSLVAKKFSLGSVMASPARQGCAVCQTVIPVDLLCVRFASMRVRRRIRGYPRPLMKGVVRPRESVYGWRPVLPEDGKYTTDVLPIRKLGGRDPITGRVVVRTIGGGAQREFRWIDYERIAPKDRIVEEKVYQVYNDDLRSAKLALVASEDKKRWIIAAEGTKVGDILRTSSEIPRIPVRPQAGDAHPLGALPLGTMVHHIEKYPGMGGYFCRAAGASAQILRKVECRVILQLPSKQEISLNEECMAVVGQVSNADRLTTFYPIGSPQRMRLLGKRPRSGFWHRKDGYCGRKPHPPKPLKVYSLQKPDTDGVHTLS